MDRTAALSECARYRYRLGRCWNANGRGAVFILLNPSTADERTDDPTIRKCIGFAMRWGCGSLQVVNLFAFRTKDRAELKSVAEPVGLHNERHIRELVGLATGPVVCGWGVDGRYLDRDVTMLGWLREMRIRARCLRLTKDGHPYHPLYVGYEAPLIPFRGRILIQGK